jgi:biopolymer transport protein ExbD
MTPMIDVVFLLLIFFVCTASFQIAESILPTRLNNSGASAVRLPPELEEVQLERILIEVGQQESPAAAAEDLVRYRVNGQPCASLSRLGEIVGALAQIDSALKVVLDIGGQVPLGNAIDVYDRCRLAGLHQIQFATSAGQRVAAEE